MLLKAVIRDKGKSCILPVVCWCASWVIGITILLDCAHFTPLAYAYSDSPWTWRCSDGISCQRELASNGSEPQVSLNVCWLSCGNYGALWPHPTIKVKMCVEC